MTNLPLATVHGLYHIAIKTDDLAATRKFWVDIIGLREFPRPDFGYPGAWLGCTQPGGLAIIHVYGGGPRLARVHRARHLVVATLCLRSLRRAARADLRMRRRGRGEAGCVAGPQICCGRELLRLGDLPEA